MTQEPHGQRPGPDRFSLKRLIREGNDKTTLISAVGFLVLFLFSVRTLVVRPRGDVPWLGSFVTAGVLLWGLIYYLIELNRRRRHAERGASTPDQPD